MDTSLLEDIGLSKGEIKVYLTLLNLGNTKVGYIIEKSGMASSAVHNAINTLIEKGLVFYIKKGKIKFYQAASPNQIVNFIEEKKKKFQEILPQLLEKQQIKKESQEAEIFEGTKGVLTMLNILIEDTKKGDEYCFFASYLNEKNEEVQQFFKKYDIKRKDKGLIIKGLAPKELKLLFIDRKSLKMKYTEFPIPHGISICKNKIAFISWGEKPIGYLIKSEQISQMFKEFFNNLWNKY